MVQSKTCIYKALGFLLQLLAQGTMIGARICIQNLLF